MLSSFHGLSVGFHVLSSSQQIATLGKGGADNINVYSLGFVSGTGAGPLDYSPFPWSYSSNGVVIFYSSAPGGTSSPTTLAGPPSTKFGKLHFP